MSKISVDIPTIEGNTDDFDNFINFIHKHERIVKQFGGIKIKPHVDCKQSLKKRRTNFSLSSNIQEVQQINKDPLIYSIQSKTNTNNDNKIINDRSITINEKNFWESLSYSNNNNKNVTIFPNKSFYSSRSRPKSFDLPCLPKLSLLKIGGNKVLRHCLPTLLRSHGPGSIYPLSSAPQRLFSIDYHHEGGNRQWYIIPPEERTKLEQILQNEICLEHQNILLNPLFFDKHHIRYHKIIQHPNEFIVLAAGALAQGFSHNSSWNETVVFALPSWLEDGHANLHSSLCNCCLNHTQTTRPIDIKQFRYELVQRWTIMNLNSTTDYKLLSYQEDHQNINANTPITPTDDQRDFFDDDYTMNTNSFQPLWEDHQENIFQFLPELLTPEISTYFYHDKNIDNTSQTQSQIIQHNSIESNQNFINKNNFDEQFPPFDLMDFTPETSVTTESAQYQSNDLCENNHQKKKWNCSRNKSKNTNPKNIKYQQNQKKRKQNRNTLFVTGLRNEVRKHDLLRHFVGSTKIILKQHQMPPHHKYAFVLHHSYSESEENRQRPINYGILGSECRIEHADKDIYVPYEQQPFTVVVTRIPENVTEDQLRTVFHGCHSVTYCPGRSVQSVKEESKLLPGYAFIQYPDPVQATNVVKNSTQYRIHDQPLKVSFFTTKKLLQPKTK